jgi:hypothetical protein
MGLMTLAVLHLTFLGLLLPTPSSTPPSRIACHDQGKSSAAFCSKESPEKTFGEIWDCLDDDDSDEISPARRRAEAERTSMLLPNDGRGPLHPSLFPFLETFRLASVPLVYLLCSLLI